MAVRDGTSIGIEDTLAALGRRQVGALVLAPRTDARGCECPACGQLYPAGGGRRCSADGSDLRELHSLRSAMIRSALLQDADVIVLEDFDDRPEIAAFDGVGALLRYSIHASAPPA
jgi:peptide subunit release factor 1 (eRF1)